MQDTIKSVRAKTVTVSTIPPTTEAKLASQLSTLSLVPVRPQFKDIKRVDKDRLAVGDIGWYPVLQLSQIPSSDNIYTEFAYISAKSTPSLCLTSSTTA
jgi:hypothetical protein